MIVRLIVSVLAVALLLVAGCSNGNGQEEISVEPTTLAVPDSSKAALARMQLSDPERQLLDTLLQLWSQRNVVVSVRQAAAMLDMDLTDSMRVALLDKLRQNQNLHPQLQLYRPWTMVLTESEKLIGQYLFDYQKDAAEFPSLEMVGQKVRIAPEEVTPRLQFLASVDFLYDLDGPTEYNQLGFSFGSKMSEAMFDMGLRFHTLYVEGGLPFNVGCTNEACYKILRDYPNNKVRYESVDPLSLEPVTILFENSEIVSISPETAIFLKGWYRGANNMFVSRESAEIWTAKTPNVDAPPYLDIKQHVNELRQQRDGSGWEGSSN
jgi:hypothetical protein